MSLEESNSYCCSHAVTRHCSNCAKKVKKPIENCPVCGTSLPPVRYCANRAGKGTSHIGQGYCRWHGGTTKKDFPLASRIRCGLPHLKTGKYSQFIFTQEDYEELVYAEMRELLMLVRMAKAKRELEEATRLTQPRGR